MSTDVLQKATGLNFELSEEQQLIRDSIRDFVERHVKPGVKERDTSKEFPHDLVKKLAEQGFMGMVHPEKYGGGGVGHVSFCLAIEEIARWDASLALTVASHTSLASGHIALAANKSQKEKYLTPLAKGEKLGAWCLTEPGSGSDASGMKTTAIKKDDKYILNGTKIFITQGSVGDTFVVLAKTDPDKGTKGISAFIIEGDWDGVESGKKMEKLGMNSSDTTEVIFEDVEVPEENLLGELGRGFVDTMKVLDGGRIGIGALSVGIARGALEESLKYSGERKQFGSPIGDFQAIETKISNIATEVDAARMLVHRAAWLKDQDKPFTKEVSMAKLFASELAVRAADEAVQIHGGYGYIKEYHVERFMRDAKLMTIGEGTSEVQRMIIGRELKKEFWG
ncbi:acyl-CoA dehydrogenase [Aliifodinibius salipaludis]|uniref:Cyclohex-1-ene-1-carbonyl-CoA dehydrogenase n=1 Tax=Fodinibius salipaludis TaxID=2032627 RepID=A0A2A2G8R5_9BACT|nr:acyl-CoA dehydrogenase family protein [Aliifodinibius salipaludis]PAU93223.1 acyl-CoA dehydrogenase [Aliifodinibius salipaludis]